jgi:hypothetical protein
LTIIREPEQSDRREAPPGEALIEEARQRQRRRWLGAMVGVLLLIAGRAAYTIVADGSGTNRIPLMGHASSNSASVATSLLSTTEVSSAAVADCALPTKDAGLDGKTLPRNLKFVELRRGQVGTMPWSFWFANTPGGPPYESLVAGSGQGTLCVESDSGGGGSNSLYGFAQLPGKPVAFVYGYAGLGPSNPSHDDQTLTRLTAVINRHHVSVTPIRVGTSSYGYLFAEVTGLRCAAPSDGSAGLYESDVEFSGGRTTGSGSSAGNVPNATSTGVYCGTAVPPLENLSADIAAAPQALRAAVLRTIGAVDVSITTAVEHPLSARTWVTEDSAYQSPDRYQGPYQPIHCGREAGSSGPVAFVFIGPERYWVEENCFDGRLVRTGGAAPKIEDAMVVGRDGLTAAEIAAFGDLLTDIHTATGFRRVADGYVYTSDLTQVDGNFVRGGAPVIGTITVIKGYVTSITSSTYALDCEPLGPSCRYTSSTTFATHSAGALIKEPVVQDYLSEHTA